MQTGDNEFVQLQHAIKALAQLGNGILNCARAKVPLMPLSPFRVPFQLSHLLFLLLHVVFPFCGSCVTTNRLISQPDAVQAAINTYSGLSRALTYHSTHFMSLLTAYVDAAEGRPDAAATQLKELGEEAIAVVQVRSSQLNDD